MSATKTKAAFLAKRRRDRAKLKAWRAFQKADATYRAAAKTYTEACREADRVWVLELSKAGEQR
jgi:hypothetical protein